MRTKRQKIEDLERIKKLSRRVLKKVSKERKIYIKLRLK
jgi:hypothetical protein